MKNCYPSLQLHSEDLSYVICFKDIISITLIKDVSCPPVSLFRLHDETLTLHTIYGNVKCNIFSLYTACGKLKSASSCTCANNETMPESVMGLRF